MLVLFLTASPLHKMHFNDMYINEIGKYFETRIWDISRLKGMGKGNPDFPDVLCINSLQELETELDCIEEQIVVITNVLIYDLHIIQKVFQKRKIPLISIDKESIIFWMRDNYLKKNLQYASDNEKRKFFWKANLILLVLFRISLQGKSVRYGSKGQKSIGTAFSHRPVHRESHSRRARHLRSADPCGHA